jgi:hypothetical protein
LKTKKLLREKRIVSYFVPRWHKYLVELFNITASLACQTFTLLALLQLYKNFHLYLPTTLWRKRVIPSNYPSHDKNELMQKLWLPSLLLKTAA